MSILGVDPGLGGALALYDIHADSLTILDMPTFSITTNGKVRRQIDISTVAWWVDSQSEHISFAIVENPHAMPKQGVSSSFSFGKSCGLIQGVIAANFIKMTLVDPRTWKTLLRVPADKDGARARASQLLPKHSPLWSARSHDGRAEAALLAYYGANVK